MYKTVLFASDLTEQSEIIAQKAKAIATQFQATLHMIHIIEPMGAYGGGWYYLNELNEELEQQANAGLEKQGEALGIVPANRLVVCGQTRDSIIEHAKKIKADLIVLGTHGAKGIAVLLGSTATSVLHSAECDVLTVKVK